MKEEKTEPAQELEYGYVSTMKGRYFGIVQKTENGLSISSAYVLEREPMQPYEVAKAYVRVQLLGLSQPNIEVPQTSIESVRHAPEEMKLIKLYDAFIPEAQKKALGVATLGELEKLLKLF